MVGADLAGDSGVIGTDDDQVRGDGQTLGLHVDTCTHQIMRRQNVSMHQAAKIYDTHSTILVTMTHVLTTQNSTAISAACEAGSALVGEVGSGGWICGTGAEQGRRAAHRWGQC